MPVSWQTIMSFVSAQFDGLEVMRKNAFGDFFGFAGSGLANRLDDVRRDFFQRLDVEIPANILDEAIKTLRVLP